MSAKKLLFVILYSMSMWASPAYALKAKDKAAIQYDAVYYDDTPAGCKAGATVLSGDDNAAQIFNFLTSKGLTAIQAAGIMGNLQQESGLNPHRVQGTPTPAGDKPEITIDGKTGYGLAQWTDKGRQQNLKNFASEQGTSTGDLATQLGFLYKESNPGGTRPNAWPEQAKQADVDAATESWERTYENADPKFVNMTNRKNYAQAILQRAGEFAGSETASPQGATNFQAANSCTASGDAAAVIQIAQQELDKHPVEYDANVLRYTDGREEAWCADFLSWVYMTAGTPFTGGQSGGWRIAGSFIPGQATNVVWTSRSENKFDPKPGDFVLVYSSVSATSGVIDGRPVGHTGVIVSVNGDTIVTIEGNSGNTVKQNTYHNWILGGTTQEILGWGHIQ